MALIVVAAGLLTAALNGSATAAVGLVSPVDGSRVHVGGPGLLIDPNTRVPGLVARKTPRSDLSVRRDPNATATVDRLEADLHAAHDARAAANVVVAAILGLLALLAIGSRSPPAARAAVLYAPAAIGLGLAWRSALAIGFGALVPAVAAAVSRRAFKPLLVAFFGAALLFLWHWPVTNALATIGPHPDGGHRFYGVTNQVETMLLAPALVAGLAAAPFALVAVGWSKAGADGGGLLVYATGYAVTLLQRFGRVTRRRAVLAAAAVVAFGIVLVAVDAATGGSSHVTHSLGTGLPGDLAHRLNVSYHGVTRSVGAFAMFAFGAALLALVVRVRNRPPLVNAMLVALAVSFLVNDTPTDVALWGALGALTVLGFERARVG
ncbi:MAG: hypothetical protein QOE91_1057 [Gaiellaceae bacterium]|nr:hypothetical protein [Gaiellaceae bacterium]